ncbi:hypothetical protein GWI33_006686 [Rhynchophorus ferrugineus]|uniref:Uncharacterized protein n=1 Tax=Rhynchophorus ferrugineus TaxID=354439 RepID=A0A834IJZ6_RHYFE|nr:hypothetical protein GWI33_006686 [Rhynchophorus ferrugineus]
MGNCLASCLPACKNTGALCSFNMLSKSKNDFTFLIEEDSANKSTRSRRFFTRLLARRKQRKKKQNVGVVDCVLNPQLSYSRLSDIRVSSQGSLNNRDIQLQCLDARALLIRTNTSTPENSLDLEWEHETLPISLIHEPSASSWTTSIFPEDTLVSQPRESPSHGEVSESDWSRVSSSANSLEWDSVQNSIQSDVDTLDIDTQFLLNEIDRLTSQALKETGVITDHDSYIDDTV